MTTALYRIGRLCARHPFRTFGVWFLIAAAVFGASSSLGGPTRDDVRLPGAESQEAFDRLEERFPTQAGASGRVVFSSSTGTLADPGPSAGVAAAAESLAASPHVAEVGDLQMSPDRRTGYLDVLYDTQDLELASYDDAQAAVEPARAAGVQVELGGDVAYLQESETGGKEMLGIAVAIVVLLVAFGSVIAMGITVGSALLGIAIGLSGVGLLAGFVDVPSVSPILAGMIGLGVGIDYALFIVTRHRTNLMAGMDPVEAAGRANATAGAAVLFAGATVIIAITGLQVAGVPAITAMGWSTAVVVAISVLGALTLLPAFLGWAGKGIDRLRLPIRRERDDHQNTASGRWADHVGTHPWRYAALSLGLLVALAAPVTSLRIAVGDDSIAPQASTQRKAYDLLSEGFGPGFNGPLQIVVDTPDDEARAALPGLEQALAATPGIAAVHPAVSNASQDTAVISAIPTTSPQAEETSGLIDRLRSTVLPAAIAGTGAEARVGSTTALVNDLSQRMLERLPFFIGAVVLLSFLLLMVVFRSILVPVKAALMNLLSIGAAYGVIVAVFQWGWGAGLIGLEDTMPINPFVPLIMFAILFGLSMDYEVFLLSRVREAFDRTGDSHTSVVEGLGATARVITSAALIMMSVFGAFIFDPDPGVKMFGVGLTAAVFIDATLIRMVLVPATMSLLGNANWWLPGWLDRLLPSIDLEGGAVVEAPAAPEVGATKTLAPVS